MERELIASERDAGSITHHAANKRLRETGQRYYSAGDDLWRHQKKKMRLADPGPEEVPILDLRRHGVDPETGVGMRWTIITPMELTMEKKTTFGAM
ncbi:hypothetical protein E4U17_005208 [Claviceps sp. LM77 group G4]|nr:hypothetical protein E4U17_005208 [Claviceps sp. LM77 group G4]